MNVDVAARLEQLGIHPDVNSVAGFLAKHGQPLRSIEWPSDEQIAMLATATSIVELAVDVGGELDELVVLHDGHLGCMVRSGRDFLLGPVRSVSEIADNVANLLPTIDEVTELSPTRVIRMRSVEIADEGTRYGPILEILGTRSTPEFRILGSASADSRGLTVDEGAVAIELMFRDHRLLDEVMQLPVVVSVDEFSRAAALAGRLTLGWCVDGIGDPDDDPDPAVVEIAQLLADPAMEVLVEAVVDGVARRIQVDVHDDECTVITPSPDGVVLIGLPPGGAADAIAAFLESAGAQSATIATAGSTGETSVVGLVHNRDSWVTEEGGLLASLVTPSARHLETEGAS